MIYDLIIIGLGPAGISAAIYAKRAGLNILCLDSQAPGGLLNKISTVDNYAGFPQATGPELAYKMFEQIQDLKVEFKIKTVTNIVIDGDIKKIYCGDTLYETKNIIIATGRKPRKLSLKNENELVGKGVSYCALCDGPLYKGKDIAIVGGGNSALEEALYLSEIVNKIYLIHRRDTFTAEQNLVDKVTATENIEIIYNSTVTELIGTDKLEKVVINNNKELDIACLFTYIGYDSYSNFTEGLNITNEKGYIIVDENCETKVKGIYAAGDCIDKKIYQIVTATSDGAIAAINVNKNIKKQLS